MSVHSTTAPMRSGSAGHVPSVVAVVSDADARWAAWRARGIANDSAVRSHFWLLLSCAAIVVAVLYSLIGR